MKPINILLFSLVFLLLYVPILIYHSHNNKKQSAFVYNVAESNQPNCVVGAFCMFAKETLNVELSPQYFERNASNYLSDEMVSITNIEQFWNGLFPTNKLICIYDLTAGLDSHTNDVINLDQPYLWTGLWGGHGHSCIVYLSSNSVTYKHFVYDPRTKTNYMVKVPYEYFFKNTIQLYTLKQ